MENCTLGDVLCHTKWIKSVSREITIKLMSFILKLFVKCLNAVCLSIVQFEGS